MATVLFLNDTQVYPDDQQNIKVNKENPYFTNSDSYTLDVTLPMDIFENRDFFKSLNRMETSKTAATMTCRLISGNKLILRGSAKITSVTESTVKVQLLGGNSELNFLSDDNKDYIDELDLGTVTGTGSNVTTTSGVRMAISPVYDETRGYPSDVYQFGLIDVALEIIKHYGYTIAQCDVNENPWNKIYIANAKLTRNVAHTLPHWKPRDFFKEFCNFFNVTISYDMATKAVSIIGNPAYFSEAARQTISPLEEYTTEINNEEEEHALSNDNLSYEMSDSDGHDYDVIADVVRDNAPTTEYDSLASAMTAYDNMDADARKKMIFKTPEGRRTGWDHDYSDWGQTDAVPLFTQIDVFGTLKRGDNAGNTSLKICPVAIAMVESVATFGSGDAAHTYTYRFFAPSLANPTGNEIASASRAFGGARNGTTEDDTATIQEYVEGEADIEKEEKEDLLQVMFMDSIPQTYSKVDSADPETYTELTQIVGFTDKLYKASHRGSAHESWSLSLNETNCAFYLGELHINGFSLNMKAKHVFKFIASDIPNPRNIFIIRNKQYACAKIEANIRNGEMDKLMTGYFYEMTS